ncbi:MAG TPA: hypothetical protein VML55_18605 [Planctomycetaceae bacterium]|nr:hypothetical protein [Planctomycetaceae bacterium]
MLAQAGGLQPAAAQQSPAAPARTRARRLPAYYGQVGLNDRQRETIYGLQAAYADRIEELERQLEALKAKRDQEIEAVLNPQQKTRLRQLVEAAAKRRAGQSRAAAPSASSGGAEP